MDLRGVVRRTIELASAVERNIPTQGTPYPTHRKTAPPLESQPNENAVQTKVCSRRRSKPVSRVLFSCAPSGIEWTRDANIRAVSRIIACSPNRRGKHIISVILSVVLLMLFPLHPTHEENTLYETPQRHTRRFVR